MPRAQCTACCVPHLVLPLRGHDLCVHAADEDASIHAGLEVALNQLTADGSARASCIWEGVGGGHRRQVRRVTRRAHVRQAGAGRLRSETHRRSNRGPGGRGSRWWASPGATWCVRSAGCTPAQCRTRAPRPSPSPSPAKEGRRWLGEQKAQKQRSSSSRAWTCLRRSGGCSGCAPRRRRRGCWWGGA